VARTLVEEFLLQIDRLRGASKNTIESYTSTLRIVEHAVGVPLELATKRQLLEWAVLLQHGPNRRANMIYTVRSFFKWLCYEMEYRDDNPAAHLRAPERPTSAIRPTPPEVVAELMTYATETGQWDLRFAAAVEYGAGCRGSEVCRLTPSSWRTYPEPLLTLTGKKGKTRDVPFTAFLKVEWDLYGTKRAGTRTGPMLVRRDGNPGPVTSNNLTLMMSRLFRAIDEPYTGHCNRKTYGTEMAATENSDIAVVSKLLGHEDIRTTMNHYVLPNMKKARGMADQLPQLNVSHQRPDPTPEPADQPSEVPPEAAPGIPRQRGCFQVIQGGRRG